jgi:hypothetical protein
MFGTRQAVFKPVNMTRVWQIRLLSLRRFPRPTKTAPIGFEGLLVQDEAFASRQPSRLDRSVKLREKT